jgi:hypothetical protein
LRTCARETSSSVLALDIGGSQPVKLDAVFPEETLFRVLLADTVVQRELAGAPPPQNLEKVLERLRRNWEVDITWRATWWQCASSSRRRTGRGR